MLVVGLEETVLEELLVGDDHLLAQEEVVVDHRVVAQVFEVGRGAVAGYLFERDHEVVEVFFQDVAEVLVEFGVNVLPVLAFLGIICFCLWYFLGNYWNIRTK